MIFTKHCVAAWLLLLLLAAIRADDDDDDHRMVKPISTVALSGLVHFDLPLHNFFSLTEYVSCHVCKQPEGSCSVIKLNSIDDDAPSGPSPPPLEIGTTPHHLSAGPRCR